MLPAKSASILQRFAFVLVTLSLGLTGCGGGSSSGSGGSGGSGSGSNPPPATETGPHPAIRTRYLRTDLQYDPNNLQFFPPHITAYDSVHKRFFVSNTTLNRIDVFDSIQELQIGSIIVPQPWGLDVSPDGSKLYVATAFGDVYLIDPGAMQVLQRFASSTIGPQGYIATEAFILADGQVALLGPVPLGSNLGSYLNGSPSFAIWNPTTNSLQVIGTQFFPNDRFDSFGQMALSADRTQIWVANANGASFALYNPATNTAVLGLDSIGTPTELLPTPDGKRIFVLATSYASVYDANTLALLDSFLAPTQSGVLSQDGSTLYAGFSVINPDLSAYDTTSFNQKGWTPTFNVVDLQQVIVASAIDETGLVFGPIGHGVAFLDGSKIYPGQEGTGFNIGYLAPNTGSVTGGTALETEVLTGSPAPNITTGAVYIGNAPATKVSLSATSFTGNTPPAAAGGAADFTVVLPDGSIALMPEDFSYGPTIVEVSTNAASAEGGAQGAIFGYGFGVQSSDVQVSVGGQAAATQSVTVGYTFFPYPFPMQAVLFTVPAGTSGASADVTVTSAYGSATASGAFHYVPAVQSYPLAGASLQQGLYDPYRSVLYFTDQNHIDVFSPANESWLAPIAIPQADANSILLGIALSPDGNTLAVSDAGDARIYVLNPASPQTVKSFNVQNFQEIEPCGLTVTNSGAVYYATFDNDITGTNAFHKLDTNTGTITDFIDVLDSGDPFHAFVRVLLSPDGSLAYINEYGAAFILSTSDDTLNLVYQVTSNAGIPEMAISGDGSALITSDFFADANFNALTEVGYVDRDVVVPVAVFGQKLNSDGSLMFQPLTNAVDEIDGTTGLLLYRVALPVQVANVYDAMAMDDIDGLLFLITDNGVVQVNLSALPPVPADSRRLRALMLAGSPEVAKRSMTSVKNAQKMAGKRVPHPELRYAGVSNKHSRHSNLKKGSIRP
jgi:hypothetical protein